MNVQITGGAGPYEAAAIVAAITRITAEQEAAAAEPPPRPQQSAWVNALWMERELLGDEERVASIPGEG